MRVPERLAPLLEQGMIDEVVRPLLSGKEAAVYLVERQGQPCVAKVYKEAAHRSFKHRSDYTEGRKVRNSRTARAMAKGSRYGREQMEAAWRTAEIDAIYRLNAAGVRVPEPLEAADGVLVMELVCDEHGDPAPRLADVRLSVDEAHDLFQILLRETVKMLCAGVVHGDLSDFNVLLAARGPVIIDFPQWVDPSANRNARQMLIRDVDNLTSFLARWDDRLKPRKYGIEMWTLFEAGDLHPDSKLTGRMKRKKLPKVDPMALLAEFEELERSSRERRASLGLPDRPARKPKVYEEPRGKGPSRAPASASAPAEGKRKRKRRKGRGGNDTAPSTKAPATAKSSLPDLDDLDALLIVDD